ncbi:MAG: Cys-tRNA(Pro) deacylase [Clostridia bacterium]|nr:Cys-tRNA(Pro) deacylase [Clostridia bacterium]
MKSASRFIFRGYSTTCPQACQFRFRPAHAPFSPEETRLCVSFSFPTPADCVILRWHSLREVKAVAKAVKTNVLRHLDALKIPYETREYEAGDEHFDGKAVAGLTGLDPEMVYKTLVLSDDKNGHLVCVIPILQELDLKKVARASGHKSVAMLPMKDLLPLTGYIRGGCSPIGMKKPFPTFIQEEVELLDTVSVSAGVRGCQVLLAPDALLRITGAKSADLTRDE